MHVIDADGLAVVHREPFEDIVAALAFETDRLRVPAHGDLHAGDFQPNQAQP